MIFLRIAFLICKIKFRKNKNYMILDWSKCFICGKAGGGDLRCPWDSLHGNGQEIYGKFLKAVEGFYEINAMPVKLEVTVIYLL